MPKFRDSIVLPDNTVISGAEDLGGGDAFSSQLLHVRDEKTASTEGGTFTSGDWRTRTLNTSVTNEITGASLATDQVTLPAGDYFARWWAPVYSVERHSSRLQDVDTPATLLISRAAYSPSGSAGAQPSTGEGRFTLASETVVELQHRCSVTRNTDGLGVAGTFQTEVFADLLIWKVG